MKKELARETVLETLGVLALACLVLGHFAERPALKTGLLAAAALLLGVALFVRPLALRIAGGWLAFGHALGAVNSRILLSLIFYLFLTPIALLARAARGDFLALKRRSAPDRSYWEPRGHTYTRVDLEKLW